MVWPKGQPFSEEHKRKIGDASRGHVPTAEARERSSKAQKGRTFSAEHRGHLSDSAKGRTMSPEALARFAASRPRREQHPRWLGPDAGYTAIHHRAQKLLPRICAHCGTTKGRLDCALRHDADSSLIRTSPKGLRYFVGDDSTEGYMRLCAPCHGAYDRLHRHARVRAEEMLP